MIDRSTIFGDIFTRPGLGGQERYIDPMEDCPTFNPFVGEGGLKGCTMEEVGRLFPSWGLEDMLDGLNHLEEAAARRPVFLPLGGGAGKAGASLAPFPLLDTSERRKFAVICPGGGYEAVCALAEGYPVARALNRMGYAAFVLHYRVAPCAAAPGPMDDLAAAVRFLLDNADRFRLDTRDYGVIGFSAGGHLAASFGTKTLGYARYNLPRPGGMALAYPVITMGEFTHLGSRNALLGNDPDGETRRRWSVERQVDGDYPPTFLWQCEADGTVPVRNSREMAKALQSCGVPVRYELFPGEAHGWGLGTGTPAEGWLARAVEFWQGER